MDQKKPGFGERRDFVVNWDFVDVFSKNPEFFKPPDFLYKKERCRELLSFAIMLCLHGKPAVTSTKENGTFWSCAESPGCFVCPEEDAPLYEKAINAFLATNQERPKCCPITGDPEGEWCYATFRVLTGKERRKFRKENIGRPVFTCGNNYRFRSSRGCGYFQWGDKCIIRGFTIEKREDGLVVLSGTKIPNLIPEHRLMEEKVKKRLG